MRRQDWRLPSPFFAHPKAHNPTKGRIIGRVVRHVIADRGAYPVWRIVEQIRDPEAELDRAEHRVRRRGVAGVEIKAGLAIDSRLRTSARILDAADMIEPDRQCEILPGIGHAATASESGRVEDVAGQRHHALACEDDAVAVEECGIQLSAEQTAVAQFARIACRQVDAMRPLQGDIGIAIVDDRHDVRRIIGHSRQILQSDRGIACCCARVGLRVMRSA